MLGKCMITNADFRRNDLPTKNVEQYISGYLLRKCSKKHSCKSHQIVECSLMKILGGLIDNLPGSQLRAPAELKLSDGNRIGGNREVQENGEMAPLSNAMPKVIMSGHIAQQCTLPKLDDSSPLSPNPLTPLDTPPIIETPTSSKRPHLETLSSIEEIPTNSQTDFKQPADQIPKKPRTSNIEEQLSPLKEHIETNASKYPLTYEELKHFYDNTRGSKDILSVARQYTKT
ncbi:hypothetical protein JTB14_030025 [Gonioctena quinquepunctata]|nr:hypothetical protein JTB14_030025 [Gonioctena quinquepunctata]